MARTIVVNMLETYPYTASKGGLTHLIKRIAMSLIKNDICVSAIALGAFASDMNRAKRDHAEAISQGIPAGRIGTAEDMAGTAIYLVSRAGDYVVGSTLIVDGGISYAR